MNINKSNIAKAWVVLFHFTSKSQDSLLFEEFSSVVIRNNANKSKGHELFGVFHNMLLNQSYKSGTRVLMRQNCEKTGWPIDVSLKTTDFDSVTEPSREMSLYFLLQEEMCHNIQLREDQPLAL